MLAIRTGIPAFNIRNGMLVDKDLKVLEGAIEPISKLPIYIDSKYFITPEYVSSTIRNM